MISPKVIRLTSSQYQNPFHAILLSIARVGFVCLFGTAALAQNTKLTGIKCELKPRDPATSFTAPVKPVEGKTWSITNGFGNVLTDKDIALPPGFWQHTGLDYVLGGQTKLSENKTVYAAGNGVVVFSTKTASNPNPNKARGGVVVIKHSAGDGVSYRIPEYKKTFTSPTTFTISYQSFLTNEVFTYYLHLDPDKIKVAQGDQVAINQPIGETYSYASYQRGTYTYPPHNHFELWKTCSSVERNGYDSANKEFQEGINVMLLDPKALLTQVTIESNVVVSTSLQISQGDSRAPAGAFGVGKPMSGSFTVTNRGNAEVNMKQLLIAGRLGDKCPNDKCPDFLPILRDVKLKANESRQFFGNFTPQNPGTYNFDVVYEKPDGNWVWPVQAENGNKNHYTLIIQSGPTLSSATPSVLTASTAKQRVVLSGTGLAKIIFCQLTLPTGKTTNLYLPLNQVVGGSPDRLELNVQFQMHGRYYIRAHTLVQHSNQLVIEVR